MKYLIISFFGLFVSAGISQSNEMNQVNQLISSFEAENNIEVLEEAENLLETLFAKSDFAPDASAYYTKAKVMSLVLRNKEVENPVAFSKDIHSAFKSALEKDSSKSLRGQILSELYMAKIKMSEIGNKNYEDSEINSAHDNYQNAISLNQLEIAYPRIARVDSSMLFTSAVFASMAKKNKAAISEFENLVEMEYGRKDIYTYLIRLYEEEEMPEKAEKIKALLAERFPEE